MAAKCLCGPSGFCCDAISGLQATRRARGPSAPDPGAISKPAAFHSSYSKNRFLQTWFWNEAKCYRAAKTELAGRLTLSVGGGGGRVLVSITQRCGCCLVTPENSQRRAQDPCARLSAPGYFTGLRAGCARLRPPMRPFENINS